MAMHRRPSRSRQIESSATARTTRTAAPPMINVWSRVASGSFALGSRDAGGSLSSSAQSSSSSAALTASEPASSSANLWAAAGAALWLKCMRMGMEGVTSMPPFAATWPSESELKDRLSMAKRLTKAIQTSPWSIVEAVSCIQVPQVVSDPQSPVLKPAATCSFRSGRCLATTAIRKQPSMFCRKKPWAEALRMHCSVCKSVLVVIPKFRSAVSFARPRRRAIPTHAKQATASAVFILFEKWPRLDGGSITAMPVAAGGSAEPGLAMATKLQNQPAGVNTWA
mmetsp:Transcript_103858/g.252142  ORF Transcript_103858/g.252142 Transcript_103858/m.252142 type:complete len:282 (+) Transcript_103858:510-1355(+)